MAAPAPLTPPECDLRGFDYMPLFGDRLFASETWISAKPEAKIAALRLWWHSFAKEAPSASLPDDDRLLSEYAGYGVAVAQWRKVKAEAMRGWVKCSDGRLYHKTVAEIALECFSGREQTRSDVNRKKKEREDRSRLFADLAEVGVTPAWNIKTSELRDLHAARCPSKAPTCHENSETCHVTGPDKGRDSCHECHGEKESKGKESKGKIEEEGGDARMRTRANLTLIDRLLAEVDHPLLDPQRAHGLLTGAGIVASWIALGADPELDILPTVRHVLSKASEPVRTWKFFDGAVRKALAQRLDAESPPAPLELLEPNHGTTPRRNRPRADGMAGAAERLIARDKARAAAQSAEIDDQGSVGFPRLAGRPSEGD